MGSQLGYGWTPGYQGAEQGDLWVKDDHVD
jgi:hypothetical protein